MTPDLDNLDARIADIVHLLEREGALGPPFKGKVGKDERRFGSKGSLSILVSGPSRGEWYDHERQEGGHTRSLIKLRGGHDDVAGWLRSHHLDEPEPRRGGGLIVKTYDYVDEQGQVLFQVVRSADRSGARSFWQRRPDGKGGWLKGRSGARLVLYHLPSLVAAKATGNGHPWRVYLCEGEKDADRLREEWGLVATTNPGGAGNWEDDFDAFFAGAEVILLEDNDKAGRARSAALAPRLARVAAAVRVIAFPHLDEGGDISDWIDAGGTQSDFDTLIEQSVPVTADPEQQHNGHARDPNNSDEEPWPEPALLIDDEWAAPPFPAAFLPAPLGEFAASQAFDMQVPLDFIGIPLLIAAATAIGREFRMAPKAHASWAERACLWGGIIGYVGDGKTPSFNAALGPIWTLQAKFRAEFQGALDTWKGRVELAKVVDKQWKKDAAKAVAQSLPPPARPPEADAPEKPVPRQLVTNDTTQERLAELMHHNPRGVMLFRDELSGWFRSFNQYRPGADEQFYLQCHAGGPWYQQRKSGDYTIPDVYLSICGGFQPDVVAEVLARRPGKADSGMAARFSLLVWPDHMPRRWVDNSPDPTLRTQVIDLFSQLLSKDVETLVGPRGETASHFPPLRFTPEGQEIFRTWYTDHHQAQNELDPDYSPLRGHFAKYDGLFAQLALIHHLIRQTLGEPVEPARIDAHTAEAVRSFIEDYLRPHARKIYLHLGRDPGYDGARRIARWILDNPAMTRFTARDVSRKQWTGLTGRDENTGKDFLRAALLHLDNVAGWVSAEERQAGPRGGRPTIDYVINPKINRLVP